MKTRLRYCNTLTVLAGAVFVLAFQNRLQAGEFYPEVVLWDNFSSGSNIGNLGGYNVPVYAPGIDDGYLSDGSMSFSNRINLGGNILDAYDGYAGGNPWRVTEGGIDLSEYYQLDFNILWDTTSGLTIDQWNTGNNWQANLFTTSEPSNYPQDSGWLPGLDISFAGYGNDTETDLGIVNIPDSAASGWQTVSIPLNFGNVGSANDESAIVFKKWCSPEVAAACSATATAKFWIDNIVLVGHAPLYLIPSVSIAKAVPGLNIINATENNSYYDRNEVAATATGGFSWVGHTPCSYSYTIAGFPASTESYAYLFIIPNAAAQDNGPDYVEPNAFVVDTVRTATGSATLVTYRVNQPDSEDYTDLVIANSKALIGTYTLTFTSNDGGYITVPDGTSATFAFPTPGTGATYFAENGSKPYNCLLYLGGQANNVAGLNQPVIYTKFSCTGIPSAFSENFAGETSLSSHWTTAPTQDPASIVMVKPSDLCWIAWSPYTIGPLTFYGLENSSLATQGLWQYTVTYTPIIMSGSNMQLVAPADLQAPTNSQYFQVISHTYARIDVVLPGQTWASGIGVSGTPTPMADGAPWEETAIGYAVDYGDNLVNVINGDPCTVTSSTDSAGSDDFAGPSTDPTMSGGIVSFSETFGFSWGNDGLVAPASETITVTDLSKGPSGTSSTVSLTN